PSLATERSFAISRNGLRRRMHGGLRREQAPNLLHDLRDQERLTGDLVELHGLHAELVAQQRGELTQVLGERAQVTDVDVTNALVRRKGTHGLVDRAVRRAPADDGNRALLRAD